MNFLIQTENINYIVDAIKTFIISLATYYFALMIINKKENKNISKQTILAIMMIGVVSIFYTIIADVLNLLYSKFYLVIGIAIIFSKFAKQNIGYSILIIAISISTNYILYFLSISISFFPNVILKIENRITALLIISIVYLIIVNIFSEIKRLKYGFSFLEKNLKSENVDILILNISAVILFTSCILPEYKVNFTGNIVLGFIVFSIIMFVTIQKSLQVYYKQKLLIQELTGTKEELEKKKQEIQELERENLNFSKKSHSLAHKQKSLEYKINQLLNNNETKEKIEIENTFYEISRELYENNADTEISKTGITIIDDMLSYMKSECIKNGIKFEFQKIGNIFYMVNNVVSKEKLEILLADHIKNAIIAINYSENINKSILLKLGKIDDIYSIFIYDSGIEFKKETLENLGKKPCTTHKESGGTGMGFMNTFDLLRKYEASLIINEIGKPSKENYTKAIIIKFDKKNEFKIISDY